MAKPLVEVRQPTEMDRLQQMDSETLKQELASQMRLTAAHLVRLAAIVKILEERGEDLADLRIGLVTWLRKIAAGQVLPEVVVRYADSPLLLQRIANLPEPDQRKLATGEPLKMMVWRETGIEARMVDPRNMTREQIAQVFGPGYIREDAEQVALLESRRAKAPPKQVHATSRVRADKVRGGIVIDRRFVAVGDILSALADLNGGDDAVTGDEESRIVPVSMLDTDHQRLKILAARSGCSMSDLIRRAMVSHGLLKREE